MSKKQKILLAGLVFILAFFLRFFRIYQTAPFLGDQGRDLLEIRESLTAGRLPLAGPLSNEGIHAGPAYYYLVIPSLLIGQFQPLGPILFTTFLGVISTFLIYSLGSKLFGQTSSFLSATLYASSCIVIQRTLGLWNPIPVPFFSILIIYAIYKIQKEKKLHWFIFLGLFLGIAIQLYIPAYFLFLPVFAWLLFKIRFRYLKWSLGGLFSFVLTLLPFFLFQFQNEFADFKNLILIFLEKLPLISTSTTTGEVNYLTVFFTLLSQQFQALLPIKSSPFALFLGIIILFLPFAYLLKRKNHLFWHKFLSFWFLSGLLFLTFYPSTTHQHYASFIWILPFLLLASFLKTIQKIISKKILLPLGLIFVLANLKNYVDNFSITNDLARTEIIADLITQKSNQQPFSILLLSDRSPSDAHFRYFLKLKKAPVKSLKNQNVSQLFLICTQSNCPSEKEIQKMSVVETECLPSCPPFQEQKSVNLADWHFVSRNSLSKSQIYLFSKKEKN